MMNSYHKMVIFVPGCLFAPELQAGNEEKKWAWVQVWRELLMKSGCNIVQMPCPESSFDCPKCGMGRDPHGVDFYEALPGFYEHCFSLSKEVTRQVLRFKQNGYQVITILGIEHSPTCASSYIYTHRGMVKRSGILMGQIMSALDQLGISVFSVGINRRYPQKAITTLSELLNTSEDSEGVEENG